MNSTTPNGSTSEGSTSEEYADAVEQSRKWLAARPLDVHATFELLRDERGTERPSLNLLTKVHASRLLQLVSKDGPTFFAACPNPERHRRQFVVARDAAEAAARVEVATYVALGDHLETAYLTAEPSRAAYEHEFMMLMESAGEDNTQREQGITEAFDLAGWYFADHMAGIEAVFRLPKHARDGMRFVPGTTWRTRFADVMAARQFIAAKLIEWALAVQGHGQTFSPYEAQEILRAVRKIECDLVPGAGGSLRFGPEWELGEV